MAYHKAFNFFGFKRKGYTTWGGKRSAPFDSRSFTGKARNSWRKNYKGW